MNFYKRIIISFLIIVSIFGVCVLYVKINELYWVNLVKKASEARLESFLKEYSMNDEASKNYRVLKPPSRGYQDYQISLTYAKYHGDPDVNVMVIFNVVLNYGNSKKSYRVEQVFMFVDEPAKSIEEDLANVKNWYMGWIEF